MILVNIYNSEVTIMKELLIWFKHMVNKGVITSLLTTFTIAAIINYGLVSYLKLCRIIGKLLHIKWSYISIIIIVIVIYYCFSKTDND